MLTSQRIKTLIGLLLILAFTVLPVGHLGRAYSGLGPLWGNESLFWLFVLVMLLYVAFVERRSLASIGLRKPRLFDIVLAIPFGIVMVLGIVAIYNFVFPFFHLTMNTAQMSRLMNTPYIYRVFLVTRAAVSEEILFRGYPIERLEELTGSKWLAALLSVAAFTYAHLAGWGAAQLIVAAFGGVVLTALYLWRRNLWANMIAHFIADGAGFLLPH